MNRSTTTLVLYLALVFTGGAAVGALSHRYFAPAPASTTANTARPSPEEFRRMFKAEMRSRVKINDEQEKQLESIMDETREKFRAFRESLKPQEKAIQAEHVAKIMAILTPEQQKEYAKMREEREQRRKAEKAAEDARRAAEAQKNAK